MTFGSELAKVHYDLITQLKDNESNLSSQPRSPFQAGDHYTIREVAFAGTEAVYLMDDREARVVVLIELPHRPIRMATPMTNSQRGS